MSPATVQRVWSARGLKPHLVRTFKLSRDPHFEEKLVDVVGLYLNPPDKAVVLCVDEKSQIQALDRTQPSLPMKKGRAGTMTHDYKRHGTTTLFAALNVLDRHGDRPMLRPAPPSRVPALPAHHRPGGAQATLDLHLILDNYGTHSHRGRGLAGQASPLPPALHPDRQLLAQPGRALVPRAHRQSHPPRRLQVGPDLDRGDRGLPRKRTTTTPNRSSGPPPPRRSSTRSAEAGRTRLNPG